MSAFVGGGPPVLYPGVITAVHAPTVEVLITDDADVDYFPQPITATGTGTVGDKVSVLLGPTGRAVLVRS